MNAPQHEATAETQVEYELQLSELGDCVWVHATDGSTVGRFGRMGIDLHNSLTDQIAGMPECRLCTHGQPTVADWDLFRGRVLEWFGIDVPTTAFDARWLKA